MTNTSVVSKHEQLARKWWQSVIHNRELRAAFLQTSEAIEAQHHFIDPFELVAWSDFRVQYTQTQGT